MIFNMHFQHSFVSPPPLHHQDVVQANFLNRRRQWKILMQNNKDYFCKHQMCICVDTKIRSMFEDRDEEAALCNDAKTTTCTYNANT